jgi:hypothetical protein
MKITAATINAVAHIPPQERQILFLRDRAPVWLRSQEAGAFQSAFG